MAFFFEGFGLMFGHGNTRVGLNGFMRGGLESYPTAGDACAFVVFSVTLVAIVYPVAGHWVCGGGSQRPDSGTSPAQR